MWLRDQWLARKIVQSCEKWLFFSVFSLFPKILGGWRGDLEFRIAWNDESVASICVPNCFYFVLCSRLAGRSAQTYEKWSYVNFLTVWIRFSLVFGLVKEKLMLECHEMIRVLHVVAFPIHFYFDFWSGLARKSLKF